MWDTRDRVFRFVLLFPAAREVFFFAGWAESWRGGCRTRCSCSSLGRRPKPEPHTTNLQLIIGAHFLPFPFFLALRFFSSCLPCALLDGSYIRTWNESEGSEALFRSARSYLQVHLRVSSEPQTAWWEYSWIVIFVINLHYVPPSGGSYSRKKINPT